MNEFNYTRDWTRPEDFPTVENSETQVRLDLQYQPNEVKAFLNYMVKLLTSQNGAAEIGSTVQGGSPTTVQGALDSIRGAIASLNMDALAGMGKAEQVDTSTDKFPTSAAVKAAIEAAEFDTGNADMRRSVYDTHGRSTDVYTFAEQAAATAASGVTKSSLGLDRVDNTADLDKPISNAMREELNHKLNETDTVQLSHGGTGATNAAGARANLGLSKLDIVNMIYPVGSLYISVNSASPASLFGGTWERVKDRFLLAAGDTYSAGATGGEAEHTLTVNEMPSHNHDIALQQSGGTVANGVVKQASGVVSDGLYVRYRGGNAAHNNMPPYLSVYMWKRTA